MAADNKIYPVIDLFAGPGGLGEGFASLRHPQNPNGYTFKTAISIEKEASAYCTLQLRHFFREFPPDKVPDDYYQYLEETISLEELYERHPEEAAHAQRTAWLCELGKQSHETVKRRITEALNGQKNWVLVGGPPCQAYSLAGRSRMSRNPEFESDPRHFLYQEYLRILADHRPPIFVMENVKGLLSARIDDAFMIRRILQDLAKPDVAVLQKDIGLEYRLFSLSQAGVMGLDADPSSFVVKAEDYSIPQARHRIFIVGIRSDFDIQPRTLEKAGKRVSVQDVIGNLPKIRSGISKSPDSREAWIHILSEITGQAWFTKGKENGRADLTKFTEEILTSIRQNKLDKQSKQYSIPCSLADWFYDEHLKVLLSHEARSHKPSDLQRYLFASVFGSTRQMSPKLSDFPQNLLPEHKNVQEGVSGDKFADRFRVQLPSAPATTITSHISKDGHYYIHYDPTQCRSLTVREAARLQTFPDNYKFEGTRTAQYHQVGNAVPPLLANRIAEIIAEVMEKMD